MYARYTSFDSKTSVHYSVIDHLIGFLYRLSDRFAWKSWNNNNSHSKTVSSALSSAIVWTRVLRVRSRSLHWITCETWRNTKCISISMRSACVACKVCLSFCTFSHKPNLCRRYQRARYQESNRSWNKVKASSRIEKGREREHRRSMIGTVCGLGTQHPEKVINCWLGKTAGKHCERNGDAGNETVGIGLTLWNVNHAQKTIIVAFACAPANENKNERNILRFSENLWWFVLYSSFDAFSTLSFGWKKAIFGIEHCTSMSQRGLSWFLAHNKVESHWALLYLGGDDGAFRKIGATLLVF